MIEPVELTDSDHIWFDSTLRAGSLSAAARLRSKSDLVRAVIRGRRGRPPPGPGSGPSDRRRAARAHSHGATQAASHRDGGPTRSLSTVTVTVNTGILTP